MGFADDMKNTYNYLRSLKPTQKLNYFKVKSKYLYHIKKFSLGMNKRDLSKKELKLIKEKIKRKIKNQRIRINIHTSIVTISLLIFVYLIIKYLY